MKVLDIIGLQHLKEILYSQRGAPNGVASLDSAGKIPTAQMPFTAPSDASTTIKGIVQLATLAEVNTGTDAVKSVTPSTLKKGSAGGVATLDANSRMPQNLTAPTETYLALGSVSGTKTISGANANVQSMTIVANTTITLTAGASASECRVLTLIITNGGAYTVTWPASVKWVGGSAPTFSAAGVDVVTVLTVNGGVTWLGSANGVSYA